MKIEYEKEYNLEEVKEIVREKQVYILDSVAEICEKHKLTYWLDGGTLLGAVRHKGFIPWDDDIDIGLMRNDYEKLITILTDELPNDLAIQSRQTDSKYKFPFVKIRDRYSQVEDGFKYNGIFIDIFPFDLMPQSALLKKIQRGLFILLEVMMIHTDINKLNISNQKGIKATLTKNGMKFLSTIGSIFGNRSFDFMYKHIRRLSGMSPSEEVGDGLTASWAYYKSIRNIEDYKVVREGEFNGKLYNIPKNYDTYLKTLYGDNYMTPIQVDNMHIEKVIFFKEESS